MAIVIGLVVAIVAVLMVLDPILRPERLAEGGGDEEPAEDPAEKRKQLALAALKEIEFDRETGKLSEPDYERMLARYTKEAVEALHAAEAPARGRGGGNGHGPAPAPVTAAAPAVDDPLEKLIAEARQANRGRRFCSSCGAVLEGSGRFCVECGASA